MSQFKGSISRVFHVHGGIIKTLYELTWFGLLLCGITL